MPRARPDDPLPPLPKGLTHPEFPRTTNDPGWMNRTQGGDGYDYAAAATSGANLVRQALAAARPAKPETSRHTHWAPIGRIKPVERPVRATPEPEPTPDWTPHDAIPSGPPSPGHWMDGTPFPEPPPDEEDWSE